MKKGRGVMLVLMPMGALLGLLSSAVITYMPKKYESEAMIEVKPYREYRNEIETRDDLTISSRK